MKVCWKNNRIRLVAITVVFFACFAHFQVAAQERSWKNTTTLSYVATSGNSSINTVGFSDDFLKKWNMMALTVKGGMIRSQSTLTSLSATGASLEDAIVKETRTASVTAENYYLNARIDYRLKDSHKWYWYGGTSWERNIPVGLDNRITATSGIGRIFYSSEKTKWRVDAGLGVTREAPVFVPEGFQKDFGTFNLTSELTHNIGKNIYYNANLASSCNLKKTDDWLYVLKQGLSVSMTKGMALKIGFDINYRNIPALIAVKVQTPDDPPISLGEKTIYAKKFDTNATTSLVITF